MTELYAMTVLHCLLAQNGEVAGEVANQGNQNAESPFSFLFPLLIIVGIFYLLIFRPESKKRKARESMVAAVKKGDTVITTGGLKARVKRVDGDEVVVVIDKDKDVKVRFLKAAVLEVLPGDGDGGEGAISETQRELNERAR